MVFHFHFPSRYRVLSSAGFLTGFLDIFMIYFWIERFKLRWRVKWLNFDLLDLRFPFRAVISPLSGEIASNMLNKSGVFEDDYDSIWDLILFHIKIGKIGKFRIWEIGTGVAIDLGRGRILFLHFKRSDSELQILRNNNSIWFGKTNDIWYDNAGNRAFLQHREISLQSGKKI